MGLKRDTGTGKVQTIQKDWKGTGSYQESKWEGTRNECNITEIYLEK